MKIKHRIAYEVIYEIDKVEALAMDHIEDLEDIDDDELLEFSESFIKVPKSTLEGVKSFQVEVIIAETYGEVD
jgi:hypothetical protein